MDGTSSYDATMALVMEFPWKITVDQHVVFLPNEDGFFCAVQSINKSNSIKTPLYLGRQSAVSKWSLPTEACDMLLFV